MGHVGQALLGGGGEKKQEEDAERDDLWKSETAV
jgi:hypothetical protein